MDINQKSWIASVIGKYGCFERVCPAAGTEKPNIIFIFADDMGYGDVSAFNENSKIQTNNIDRIANEGVVFYRCPFQFVC